MALRNATPIAFRPAGISDALDASPVMKGAMALLQNLIPDPSTRHLWQCRPAVVLLSEFTPTFPNPTYVPTSIIVGDIMYGMVSTSTNPGFDEPFAFDLINNVFIPVTGVSPANVPTSLGSGGEWSPPQMALIGTKLMVAHKGFSGLSGAFVGEIDITTPTSPAWSAGNMGGLITFTTVPSFVAQFNERAWYVLNPPTGQPSLVFSDPLNPLNATNANQALTFGDSQKLSAMAGSPLSNQVVGGVVQSLMVFKSTTAIYQVTGDAATSNLEVNALPTPTGTLAPDTVVGTPYGLAFVAVDGLRVIDFTAKVSDPIGNDGDGKTLPFSFSVVPSRMNAACNGTVYRISTQDGSMPGAPVVEYWFDLVRKIWSGPHTFPFSQLQPYKSTFIGSPYSGTPGIYRADHFQSSVSTFVENGVQLSVIWRTCQMPDTDQMSENAMIQTTLYMALPPGNNEYVVKALDPDGHTLQQAPILAGMPTNLTRWGQFTWGQAPWFGVFPALNPRQIAWPAPVEFRRMQIDLSGPSSIGLKIGTLHLRYQQLGYLQQDFVVRAS